jgi:methylmalonyl-CoA mutase N-terminal domain/subunit
VAYESGVADTVDPLGGSYLIESLTDALEAESRRYLDRIEAIGGALAAIEQGYQQREIQESSYRTQRDIEAGKMIVVGVNRFVSPYPMIKGIIRVDPAEAAKQKERLAKVKKERDNAQVARSLARLEEVARGKENTMPAFVECVEVYASIGEICGVLRRVFGEQKEFLVF